MFDEEDSRNLTIGRLWIYEGENWDFFLKFTIYIDSPKMCLAMGYIKLEIWIIKIRVTFTQFDQSGSHTK